MRAVLPRTAASLCPPVPTPPNTSVAPSVCMQSPNVLLGKYGTAKISDVGMAKVGAAREEPIGQ